MTMWDDLTVDLKAKWIAFFAENGIYKRSEVKDRYNLLLRINKSDADFVLRLKDPDRAYIKDWQNPDDIATHKMSWADDGVVYSLVLNVNGKLVDFSRLPYSTWAGYDNAVRNGDTIHMTPEDAEWFTTHYKDFYPGFNEYKKGGSIHIKHPGRLTALKKRTGKTEAELWKTGSKAVRKMITFARNARKWKHQDGGYLDDIIWDNVGLWNHPGLITGITGTNDGTDITMNGVADYLIGKDNLGNVKFMKPGMNYHFPGSSVVEYPLKYQFGGLSKRKPQVNYLYSTYGLNDYGQPRYEGSYNNPIFGYQPLSDINQSIGRDYSMPDYGAVAHASYPIYMNEEPVRLVVNTFDPVTLRNRLMYAESAGNPLAKSSAGALGLFQIMPDTLKWYQEQTKDYGDVNDPVYNERVRDWLMDWIYARPLLLREDIDEIEKQRIAIASYNGGYNAIKNIYNKHGKDWIKHLPKETRDYVGFIVDGLDTGGGRTNKAYNDWYSKGNKYIKQYGGLIKPFSYTDIPVVRYGFGGYSYI